MKQAFQATCATLEHVVSLWPAFRLQAAPLSLSVWQVALCEDPRVELEDVYGLWESALGRSFSSLLCISPHLLPLGCSACMVWARGLSPTLKVTPVLTSTCFRPC
jgi:hypothetical protein